MTYVISSEFARLANPCQSCICKDLHLLKSVNLQHLQECMDKYGVWCAREAMLRSRQSWCKFRTGLLSLPSSSTASQRLGPPGKLKSKTAMTYFFHLLPMSSPTVRLWEHSRERPQLCFAVIAIWEMATISFSSEVEIGHSVRLSDWTFFSRVWTIVYYECCCILVWTKFSVGQSSPMRCFVKQIDCGTPCSVWTGPLNFEKIERGKHIKTK